MKSESSLFNTIKRKVGSAIKRYNMISENDKILVGLSGGKDSLILLQVLKTLQYKAPINFEIEALHIQTDIKNTDIKKLKQFCDNLKIVLHITDINLDRIIRSKKNRKSYCAFCSRLRRGYIYKFASKNAFDKIALGHHREDFNETLLMNMFFSGIMKSMAVKLISDDSKNTVIRPMVNVSEELILKYSNESNLKISEGVCCHSWKSSRKFMKNLLDEIEMSYPKIKNNLLASQTRIIKSHLLEFSED